MEVSRNYQPLLSKWLLTIIMIAVFAAVPVNAQDEATYTGTVVSSSRNTVTVRGNDGQFRLFVFKQGTRRPDAVRVGSEVRITSSVADESGVRQVSSVTVQKEAAEGQQTGPAPVIPPEVQRLERQIERQVRRYQVGVRAGVALDPELVLIGVHAQVGPFFIPNVYFRPNVEFGFGEVTAMFSLNPEFIYQIGGTRRGRSTYLGVGPGFNFLHQNFERNGEGSRIDFGEFKSDVGLNILGGMRYANGMFMELKTTIYSEPSPTLRLILGYNF